MRHEITIEGKNFRLRPVAIEDAAFIVELRNDPQRSRFINPISPRVADQEQWLEHYFARPGDYYFIIEHKETARPEGTISIYDLDANTKRAEWGRWVVRPGSAAAVESAVLVYRAAFDVLGLEAVGCCTLVGNDRVISFHEACGLTTVAKLSDFLCIDGVSYDAVEQRMSRDDWAGRRASLEAKANWVAKLHQVTRRNDDSKQAFCLSAAALQAAEGVATSLGIYG